MKRYHEMLKEKGRGHISLSDPMPEDARLKSSRTINGVQTEPLADHISESLSNMTEREQAIMLLYYMAGFTEQETGEILNLSVGKVHYSRLKALKELKGD